MSRTGVTGAQKSISDEVRPLVERIRRHSDLPVAVGFGISEPSQVTDICRQADGAVVGSALVRCIEENLTNPRLAEKVGIIHPLAERRNLTHGYQRLAKPDR